MHVVTAHPGTTQRLIWSVDEMHASVAVALANADRVMHDQLWTAMLFTAMPCKCAPTNGSGGMTKGETT